MKRAHGSDGDGSTHTETKTRETASTAFRPSKKLAKYSKPTVWHVFTPLAKTSNSVNLGQGFPGWHPPSFVTEALSKHISSSDFMNHQYTRSQGELSLVKALACKYSQPHRLNRSIDPLTEVITTNGATEALFSTMNGILNPGDEVIIIEPAFDIYHAQVEMNGAVLKPVPLRVCEHKTEKKANIGAGSSTGTTDTNADTDADTGAAGANTDSDTGRLFWGLDMQEFERAFSDKTRIVLLNTPHNPTGKVFSRDELLQMCAVIKQWPNVTVVADEVYEEMVYSNKEQHTHKCKDDDDSSSSSSTTTTTTSSSSSSSSSSSRYSSSDQSVPHAVQHVSIASLPGMFDRTITISSSGKTFSVTGWKVGWAIGPEHLIRCVQMCHQWVCFSVNTPCQLALSEGLKIAEEPYTHTKAAAQLSAPVPAPSLSSLSDRASSLLQSLIDVFSPSSSSSSSSPSAAAAAAPAPAPAAETAVVFPSYYHWLNNDYKRKVKFMCAVLKSVNITPISPQGGFFIVGDTSGIDHLVPDSYKLSDSEPYDWRVCRWLTEAVGVAVIPPSSFYCDENKNQAAHLARFAVCKPDHVLIEAATRLFALIED